MNSEKLNKELAEVEVAIYLFLAFFDNHIELITPELWYTYMERVIRLNEARTTIQKLIKESKED